MKYQINSAKYLSKSEFQNLERILENDWSRDGILIKVAIATGARAQEILNIRIHDLDDHNNSVLIYGLKNSKDRSIPLQKPLFNALMALALKNNGVPFDISYQRFYQIWAKYTPNCRKSIKSLRHSFAINHYRRTNDIMLIKSALGHRNLNNTNVYAEHVYENEKLKKLLVRKTK